MVYVLVFPSLLNIRVCGSNVDVFDTHSLSCRCSGGCIPRHAAVNETICCALVSGGVPGVWRCTCCFGVFGVCHDDGKRSDDMSLIPWLQDLSLLWDFTCSDTLGPSNLSTSPNFCKWCQPAGKLCKVS